MQNHEYFFVNMHKANIYTKNYANDKNLQVNTVRHSHPPTANCAYQHLSSIAHLRLARTLPVRRLYHACALLAHGLFVSARLRLALHHLFAGWNHPHITVSSLYCAPAENLSRFCKIFTIVRINCFAVWNN